MDFVIELLKALGPYAWPVVVLLLGWPLRKHIKALADRVKRIKGGGVEIELGDVPSNVQLEAPTQQADQKALPPPKETPQLEAGQPGAEGDLVSYAPDGAVINAWARLEDTMRREAARLEVLGANEGAVSAGSVITRLLDANVIDDRVAKLARQLWELRNKVTHGARVAEVAAARFVDTADSLIRTIETYGDISQLRRIFAKLRVDFTNQDHVRQIRVGPLSAIGVSASDEAAADMARRRSKMWAASANRVIMAVTERDAALLLARGATLGDPEARDNYVETTVNRDKTTTTWRLYVRGNTEPVHCDEVTGEDHVGAFNAALAYADEHHLGGGTFRHHKLVQGT